MEGKKKVEQQGEMDKKRPQPLYMDGDIAIIDFQKCDVPELQEGVRLDCFMFLPCASGHLRLSVNTHTQQLSAGDILLCRPNDQLSAFEFSPDFRGMLMCISREAIRDSIRLDNIVWKSTFVLNENPILRLSEEELQLFSLYGQMIDYRLRMKNRPYGKEVMAALVRAILLDLLVNIRSTHPEQPDPYYRRKDSLFQAFMEKISSMEVKPRSVTWYAEQLCVTPKYLTSICKKSCGRTAFDLINEAVLTDVRYQLKYSQKSIKEIADYLDFPNISFFGKYVRHHIGCSPKEYRRRLQSER
ncbi:MAG: helix-turn-helix domain-containing protein [Parabacteroides sp.]